MQLIEIIDNDIKLNCNPDIFYPSINKNKIFVRTNALNYNFNYNICNDMYQLNIFFIVTSFTHNIIYYVGNKKIIEIPRESNNKPTFYDWIAKNKIDDVHRLNLISAM